MVAGSLKPKVFGIGLSRTGTRSLAAALDILGFDVAHYPTDQKTYETLIRGDAHFPLLNHYDGMTDITVVPYYEELDNAWPGSKFVLTVRDEVDWLNSCHWHWNRPRDPHDPQWKVRHFLRAAVYGCYDFNEARFRCVYRRHVDNVTRYFANRHDHFLRLDITAGQGYELLAPFLGLPVPSKPFPHKGSRNRPPGR